MKFSFKQLLKAFIAIPLLSLFADIVYEGARSIVGPYLNLLAAPAIAAGTLYVGEFLSNAMKLIGGVEEHKLPPEEYIGL
ncbi:MAG: hypothetical protein QXR45_14470 [Candidatus Bathyarchaeia archaeon]